MIPYLTTLQEQGKLRVHSHVELHQIRVHGYNLLTIEAVCRKRDAKFEFTLLGKDHVKTFLKKFRKGDFINVVSEDWVVRRLTKGIDVEV